MIITDKEELKTGRVLIDFWAEWCGPCRVSKPKVEKLANDNPDLKVYFCNVDEDHILSDKYQIRSIPTLVYLEDDVMIKRAVGVLTDQQLSDIITRS